MALSKPVIGKILASLVMSEQSRPGSTSASLASITKDTDPRFSPAKNPEALKKSIAMFSIDEPQLTRRVSAATTMQEWVDLINKAHEKKEREVGFFTSGSSGEPVLCSHAMWVYEQEVAFLAELFSKIDHVVSLVPPHHIYGFLFGVLLPNALSVEVDYLEPLPNNALVNSLKAGDLLVAFPLIWKGLASLGYSFNPGIYGITSTGPCPPEVISQVKQLGITQMTEIFGSSQTGGVGYRNSPDDPYTLMPFWLPNKSRNIWGRRHPLTQEPHQFQVQDELEWTGDNSFLPLRRADKAIVVAGVNVYPQKVRDVILKHPNVKDCAVRLMSPSEGNRLKAFVVPVDATLPLSGFLRDLQRHMSTHLTSPETPRAIKTGTDFPVNKLGKLHDW
jgi:long-chain acyl-CoA synthetase